MFEKYHSHSESSLFRFDINLKYIYHFLVAAETGSITKAAQKLYVSQSVLSKQIISLEEKLGVALFFRGERTLTLTKYGKFFSEKWNNQLQLFCEDLEEGLDLRKTPGGTLRIGCFPAQNLHRFMHPFSDHFQKCFPEISLVLYSNEYTVLLDRLQNRDLDMIFMAADDLPEHQDHYGWRVVRRVPLVAVVPCTSGLAAVESVEMEQLKEMPLIGTDPDGNVSRRHFFYRMLEDRGIPKENIRFVNSKLTAYSEAEQNHGIALGIRANFPTHSDRVRIVELLGTEVAIAAVWNKNLSDETKKLLHHFFE